MKFRDYYQILEISQNATNEEIKKAFKEQAIKWHPDKNKGKDTTLQMQIINEAYLILKDKEARQRYDKEYQNYYNFVNKESNKHSYSKEENKSSKNSEQKTEDKNNTFEYEIKDEILKQWIKNAQKQAVDLAKQTIQDLTGVTKAASKGCFTGIVMIVIVTILIPLLRTCI